jgi:hypothetical protein
MWFYAFSGHYVHEASNQLDMLMATIKQPARSLATVLPSAPPDLVKLVDRALEYDPAARWQCAEDMALAAKEVFQQLTGTVIPATERAHCDGKEGWARATVAAAASELPPSGVDVVINDASLCVSIVFEPDTLVEVRRPVDEKQGKNK